ncbi:MAG TPA: PorP/SprF family type IX secretion system membrane protein [Fluviicola sp.]|nr:PorP/SprF family type IX secretion system membrane protein [Fluviicola sp.]
MKHLEILFFTALCFVTGNAFSQQEPVTSQFWNSYLHTNPATAGLFYKHAANAHYRNQWVGVNGAPVTLNVNYAMRWEKIRSGLGMTYQYDEIGFNRTNKALVNYAYHLKLGETALSFGAAGGLDFLTISHPEFIGSTSANDPLIPSGDTKYSPQFTSNVGIAFHSNFLNAGISCTQLNEPTFKKNTTEYNAARHYWLFLEYNHDFSDNFSIQPRIQIVTDEVKATYMASIMTTLYQKLWFGVNYSVDNYIGGMIGYDFFGKYRVGYGYDYTTNKLNNVSQGTHEIVLSYLIK